MKAFMRTLFIIISVLFLLSLWSMMLLSSYHEFKLHNEKVTLKVIQKTRDTYELAKIINAECLNCNESEKYKVGSVVLNRAEFKRKTILEVIEEENQFKGYLSNNYYADSLSIEIANNLSEGIGRDSLVYYFFDATTNPCWSSDMTVFTKSDYHHKFAY